jgi:hypothetical protein
MREIDHSVLQSIERRSTPQLLALLRAREEYVPMAVEAALAELLRRQVSGFDVSDAMDDGEDHAQQQRQLSELPLSLGWKILWLAFPFLAITPFGAAHFLRWAHAGHRRRSIQFLEATTIGFTGYILLAMLLLNLF